MMTEINRVTDMADSEMKLNEFNRIMMESDQKMEMLDEMMGDGVDTESLADDELDKIYGELGIKEIMSGEVAIPTPNAVPQYQ